MSNLYHEKNIQLDIKKHFYQELKKNLKENVNPAGHRYKWGEHHPDSNAVRRSGSLPYNFRSKIKDCSKFNSDGTIKPQFLITSKKYKTSPSRHNEDSFIDDNYLNELNPISNPASRYCNDERIRDPYVEQGSTVTPVFISSNDYEQYRLDSEDNQRNFINNTYHEFKEEINEYKNYEPPTRFYDDYNPYYPNKTNLSDSWNNLYDRISPVVSPKRTNSNKQVTFSEPLETSFSDDDNKTSSTDLSNYIFPSDDDDEDENIINKDQSTSKYQDNYNNYFNQSQLQSEPIPINNPALANPNLTSSLSYSAFYNTNQSINNPVDNNNLQQQQQSFINNEELLSSTTITSQPPQPSSYKQRIYYDDDDLYDELFRENSSKNNKDKYGNKKKNKDFDSSWKSTSKEFSPTKPQEFSFSKRTTCKHEEEKEEHKPFKATPIPATVKEPLFNEMMEIEEFKRITRKNKSKEEIKKTIKPFKGMEERYFESQVKKTVKLQKEEEDKELEVKKSRFKANTVDPLTKIANGEVLRTLQAEKLERKLKANANAQILLEEAHAPSRQEFAEMKKKIDESIYKNDDDLYGRNKNDKTSINDKVQVKTTKINPFSFDDPSSKRYVFLKTLKARNIERQTKYERELIMEERKREEKDMKKYEKIITSNPVVVPKGTKSIKLYSSQTQKMIEESDKLKKKEMEEELKKKEKSHKLFLERKEYYHDLTNPEHYIQESLLKTEVKRRQRNIKAIITGKKESDNNNDTIKSRKSMNETKDDFGDESGVHDDVEESKSRDNNNNNNNNNNGDEYTEEEVNKKIDLKYIPPELRHQELKRRVDLQIRIEQERRKKEEKKKKLAKKKFEKKTKKTTTLKKRVSKTESKESSPLNSSRSILSESKRGDKEERDNKPLDLDKNPNDSNKKQKSEKKDDFEDDFDFLN